MVCGMYDVVGERAVSIVGSVVGGTAMLLESLTPTSMDSQPISVLIHVSTSTVSQPTSV